MGPLAFGRNLVSVAQPRSHSGRVLSFERAIKGPSPAIRVQWPVFPGFEHMKTTFLDFEQPIAELEAKIEELRFVQDDSAVDISEEIERLSKKSQQLTKDLYANLTPWQVSQIARHPQRPYTLDYVNELFTDFHELHGDRSYADDLAIVGGLARFNGQACMVIGQQKGRDPQEPAARNFGMPRPE